MQEDFHYYATYSAAYIAGFSHEESLDIAYSAQLVDHFSKTLIKKLKAPMLSATTQLQGEMMDAKTDVMGLQDITRIWSSFHFLPADLYARPDGKRYSKMYLDKYRLLCGPNGSLVADTVENAKNKSLQAVGISMHVLADTWAHRYFAGTPSLVMNNVTDYIYEIYDEDGESKRRKVNFIHNPTKPDDINSGTYTNTVFQQGEAAIMNLGHGRCGHLPDYSFIKYAYLPAWMNYEEIVKDNVSDYYHAFCQMVYALKYIRGEKEEFCLNCYDMDSMSEYEDIIKKILSKRQLLASEDWKNFGEELSGCKIEDFDILRYQQEYIDAEKHDKENTYIGKFIHAALSQKSMVTHRIHESTNLLAGFSVEFNGKKFMGIKDFKCLIDGTFFKQDENV